MLLRFGELRDDPLADFSSAAAREQFPAVAAERDRVDRLVRHLHFRTKFAPGEVEQTQHAIIPPGRQELAVGREGHRVDRVAGGLEGVHSLPDSRSHRRTVLSWLAEASCFPSGEMLTR